MKVNDLIESPLSKYGVGSPMGLTQRIGAGLRSFVPGSIGQRASGELDVGKVANEWKKEYMQYIGRIGGSKHGTTETLTVFLKKTKNFTDREIQQVFKGAVTEASMIYERDLTVGEIDNLMLRAARLSAASEYDSNAELPDINEPKEPGMLSKALSFGKNVLKKKPSTPKIEPTIDAPTPAENPQSELVDIKGINMNNIDTPEIRKKLRANVQKRAGNLSDEGMIDRLENTLVNKIKQELATKQKSQQVPVQKQAPQQRPVAVQPRKRKRKR